MATPNKNTIARKRPDIQESVLDFDLQANENKMIADRIFPMYEVGIAGGNYGRIPIKQLLQHAETHRASGASYQRIQFEFEEAFFQTCENGLEGPVDERDKHLYADYFDHEVVTAEIIRHTILMNREIRVRDKTFGNAAINGTARVAPWSDHVAANPIKDVHDARKAIYKRTGLWAKSLILSYCTFLELQQCEVILNRIAAQGAGDKIKATDVNESMIAQVLNIDELVVGGGSMDNAKKGLPLDVDQIWDPNTVMMAKLVSPNSRNIREPGLGRSFHWSGDGSQINGLQESYWTEENRSNIHRCRHETDERTTYPEAAQKIENVLT